jgi:penicillin-binding protein 1C
MRDWWLRKSRKAKVGIGFALLAFAFFTWFAFALPVKLFDVPYSTTLEDHDGKLLSAAIAADGQWRFVNQTTVPEKFKEALIQFEDKRFSNHLGVDLIALGRAVKQNIAAGKVVSGGSTITMQVMRLSRKNKNRNLWNKVVEMILATRLELGYSKDEILNAYTSHAPFGGNVVGLSAASVRYFGNNASELSWAEAAMLAVLPNNPALIHPGRNRVKLLDKRNRLLLKLFKANKFDSLTYSLAIDEPLPEQPLPFPHHTPHLLWQSVTDGFGQQRLTTTISQDIQLKATEILNRHAQRLMANHVYNGAILVADVSTGNVVAYVGNTASSPQYQEQVNIVTSPRSTGSILKPFLYAALLEEGKILPHTLIPDIPLELGGFAPENFSHQFDGAVPAHEALIRSLNVPAVFELREYRHEKFHTLLKQLGMTTLKPSPNHYGLTLILGGAESTLWDVVGMYASMGRVLNNYFERPGKFRYSQQDIRPLQYVFNKNPDPTLEETSPLQAGSLWATMEALKELYRPGEESGWRNFNSTKSIAWKTGTSLGHRDAWAIGLTPEFVVGVWVGNADGEGRPNLTGTEAAAPIMLDMFSSLPGNRWFNKPNSELVDLPVCTLSGMRAGDWCTQADTMACPSTGINTLACSYHKQIHLTLDKQFRVNSQCEDIDKMTSVGWFVLPPVQEYYFKQKNIAYKPLPPFRKDCINPQSVAIMDIVYPKVGSQIYLPVELDGTLGKLVLQAAHRQKNSVIYWHLDSQYIGQTRQVHQLTLPIEKGTHKLTLMDESGEVLEREFTVLSKR